MVSGNAGRKNDSQKKNSNIPFIGISVRAMSQAKKEPIKKRNRLPRNRQREGIGYRFMMPGRVKGLDPSLQTPDDGLAGASDLKTVEDHQEQRRQHEKADDDEQEDHRQRRQRKLPPGKKRRSLEGATWLMTWDFSLMTRPRPLVLLYEAEDDCFNRRWRQHRNSYPARCLCLPSSRFIGARELPDLRPSYSIRVPPCLTEV